MIIGDSIGVGIAHERPECVSYVKGGINSLQWNRKFADKNLKTKKMIISLGSNDHFGVHTFNELMALRQSVDADSVYWIVPAIKPDVQEHVKIIAMNYNDVILTIPRLQKDGIHPSWAGYKELAEKTKK